MLPNTLYEIRGYPYIESPITTAGKYVNAREFHHIKTALDSRFRGNDGSLRFCLPQFVKDLHEKLLVLQADGEEDRFQGPGVGGVSRGLDVQLGPVEEAVEGLLVFLAERPAEFLPRVVLPFQNLAEW
jgi:hypothetical protein